MPVEWPPWPDWIHISRHTLNGCAHTILKLFPRAEGGQKRRERAVSVSKSSSSGSQRTFVTKKKGELESMLGAVVRRLKTTQGPEHSPVTRPAPCPGPSPPLLRHPFAPIFPDQLHNVMTPLNQPVVVQEPVVQVPLGVWSRVVAGWGGLCHFPGSVLFGSPTTEDTALVPPLIASPTLA